MSVTERMKSGIDKISNTRAFVLGCYNYVPPQRESTAMERGLTWAGNPGYASTPSTPLPPEYS